MKRLQKIAIVAGEIADPRSLILFEGLHQYFDVTVFALDSLSLQRANFQPGVKIRIYENSEDMPGYLRGLEEELARFDAVIGIETSRLATFQAVRAARKYGIPLGVIVNEFQPYFYEKYPNIRAIQFDICHKADIFWTTSQLASQVLRLDHVVESSIFNLDPMVDTYRFVADDERRKKFRKYVGIDSSEIVLLFQHDLVAHNRPQMFLDAIKRLQSSRSKNVAQLRLIFAGQGSAAMDLKYRAYDLGLGSSVLFLHQNPEPFLADLYAATDLMVMPRALRTDEHERLPLSMLEAMGAGAVPVVGAGSIAAELAAEAGHLFVGDDAEHLAASLQGLLDQAGLLSHLRSLALTRVQMKFSRHRNQDVFVQQIIRLLTEYQNCGPARRLSPELLNAIESDLARLEPRLALVKIEEALLLTNSAPQERAAIFRLKGDAHSACKDYEEAMSAYSEALKCDPKNQAAMRGLGFVSWHSHSHEEALVFFRKALALDQDDSMTLYGIGLVYRRLGLVDEAVFWLQKCLMCDAPPVAAIIALSQACLQWSQPERAVSCLEKAIESIGEQKPLLMALGQLYVNLGRTEEGESLLERALTAQLQAA